MTVRTYHLPDGTVPVLLSSDAPELLRDEAAALLSYATTHPEVSPQQIAAMLFRTRIARPYRALAMVAGRDELLAACKAIADGHDHASVVCSTGPATTRRVGYVFPGQGGQRPGMGRLFYEQVPAYRSEVDRCADAVQAQCGESPLDYLLDERRPARDNASTVQPVLFAHMAGLAAAWRSFGIAPRITVGHSQGEIAASYVSGAVTLADAVRIIGIRARAADEFSSGDYAMAVVAADRDTCEDLLARCPGWAQLSVLNSPTMTGISGDRETVQGIVDTFTHRGTFARVIRVHYPAHTSAMNEVADKVRQDLRDQLDNPRFLDTDTPCLGATLGGPITADLPVEHYWFQNLRNPVRFDKAIAAALPLGTDTFLELADHPTLQLAIEENLAALDHEPATLVVGTSRRTATDLGEFTRNLGQLAVHDLDYPWHILRTESDGPTPLPLRDFPNTLMAETRLWLPCNETPAPPARPVPPAGRGAKTAPPQLLVEDWVRLSQRALVPPRSIGIVDHTGACAELAAALCAAAGDVGATACVIDGPRSDLDTHVILLSATPGLDDDTAAAEVATFFADRTWWPVTDQPGDCWLVTVGAESVVADDAPPDLVHAAASAGFRCIGAEHPGARFRHLDLPAGSPASAAEMLSALHTADESELALRGGGLYAKRIVEYEACDTAPDSAPPEHVLIIGGTGNLGLEFCDYFARRGARRITLVSRSGETDAVAARLQQLRSTAPAHIHVAACDVGDQEAVAALAEQHRDAPADLIIHAAMNYADVELADLTAETIERALRAKVVGIWRILSAFPRTDDCRVVLCSSAAATIGGRGQIGYAAANRMLDAMAHRLRAAGTDCVSVQWGQWAVVDLDAAGRAKLAATGMLPMSPADALAVGMTGLRRNAIVAAFDLARVRPVLGAYGYGPLLSKLSSPAVEAPAPAATTDRSRRLTDLLAQTIGVDSFDDINAGLPLVAIGLDSLQALEFRRRVKAELNHDLDVAGLLGGATIADVLARLGG